MLNKTSRTRRQKGISNIEIIPVLLLFAMFFNFSLGFFGVIHAGIINSIAARNYSFETFRNRSNLYYLRDITGSSGGSYYRHGYRFHGITEVNNSAQDWIVTRRPVKFTLVQNPEEDQATASEHVELVRQIQDSGKVSDTFTGQNPSEGSAGVSMVWVQTLYGICLNATCSKK